MWVEISFLWNCEGVAPPFSCFHAAVLEAEVIVFLIAKRALHCTIIKIQTCPLPWKSPSCYLFRVKASIHPTPTTIPNSWQPTTVFHPYDFVISTILHKWNQTACELWRWPFFTRRNWKLFRLLYVPIVGSFLVLVHGCTILFNHSPVGGHLVCSSCWLWCIQLLWTIMNRFFCTNINFHSSGTNAQECNC